ncbi:MAG: MBL fold metallo-hydrolase, partial [Candidatus Heimdallarchaeota archaeon]|nr:MBL fold metallo-hydrolase [Candidatus Heimdallarchaeota archaeon]
MKYSFLMAMIVSFVLSACTGSEKTEMSQIQAKAISTKNRILNLYDAFGKENEQAIFDFGFSALIEFNGKTILFDSGTDAEIFKQNVKAFGDDLSTVDFAVGSHSHSDHISGFDYLLEVNPKVKIYLPKDFFGLGAPISFRIAGIEPEKTQTLPKELQYFRGEKEIVEINPSGRFWQGNVEYVTENLAVADGIKLVATTSPFLGNFSKYPNLDAHGNPNNAKANFIGLPELSLVLENAEEQFLIVGCSHSTVEAIVKEAIEFTDKKIALVMGGYHLIPYKSEELLELAHRLKDDLGIEQVAP